jgi:hypothetical protein
MKPLSESLEELSARVKALEDSATATYEADRAQLETRRQEIDAAFKAELGEFESAIREATEAGRTWWNETKASMTRPVEEIRARVQKRQSEHELHRATRLAEAAEEDAAAAVEVAAYFLNVAEYAVIDAALARMTADDLAAAPTVGAAS